jgi:hypothetical protein
MVADREVLVVERLDSAPHGLERVATIRGLGVAMQVATDVAQGNEVRQLAARGSRDLAAILAKLGLDVGQLERSIDVPARLARRGACAP